MNEREGRYSRKKKKEKMRNERETDRKKRK